MFDSAYPFRYVNHKVEEAKGEDHVTKLVHIFTFRAVKEPYIVEVEQYQPSIYAIKYYLKKHRLSKNKYRLMANNNNASKVIGTCLKIMVSLYDRDPRASFGFIGSPSLDEEIDSTKRFCRYADIMRNVFSVKNFQHYSIQEQSLYLLINRNVSQELAGDLENQLAYIWNTVCIDSDYSQIFKYN